MNESDIEKLCQQTIVDYPLIDDWLLWYFLTKFYGLKFNNTWQGRIWTQDNRIGTSNSDKGL